MVARVLFPVPPWGGTAPHPQAGATKKALPSQPRLPRPYGLTMMLPKTLAVSAPSPPLCALRFAFSFWSQAPEYEITRVEHYQPEHEVQWPRQDRVIPDEKAVLCDRGIYEVAQKANDGDAEEQEQGEPGPAGVPEAPDQQVR